MSHCIAIVSEVQVFDTPQVSTVLRSNLMRLYLIFMMIETGENSKQNLSTDKNITKFYKFCI